VIHDIDKDVLLADRILAMGPDSVGIAGSLDVFCQGSYRARLRFFQNSYLCGNIVWI